MNNIYIIPEGKIENIKEIIETNDNLTIETILAIYSYITKCYIHGNKYNNFIYIDNEELIEIAEEYQTYINILIEHRFINISELIKNNNDGSHYMVMFKLTRCYIQIIKFDTITEYIPEKKGKRIDIDFIKLGEYLAENYCKLTISAIEDIINSALSFRLTNTIPKEIKPELAPFIIGTIE